MTQTEKTYKALWLAVKSGLSILLKDIGRVAAWVVVVITAFTGLDKIGADGAVTYIRDAVAGPVVLRKMYEQVFAEDGSSRVQHVASTTANLDRRVSRLESLDNVDFMASKTARYEAGIDGRNIRVNQAYADLLNCSKSDLIGFGWRSFVTREFLEIYDVQWGEAYRQGRYFTSFIEFRHPVSGERVSVIGEHFPVRDTRTTELLGYQGIFTRYEDGK